MKLFITLGCLFLAACVSQIYAAPYTGIPTPPTAKPEYTGPPTLGPSTSRPTPPHLTASTTTTIEPPQKPSCGSNNLGDYQGGCDESVPVIVMPKGRPIMERILDWFKCTTTSCDPEKATPIH